MTQSTPSRDVATGHCRTPRAAAALRHRERSEALPAAATQVHVWFASPSPSSRYLDIVLARREPPSSDAWRDA